MKNSSNGGGWGYSDSGLDSKMEILVKMQDATAPSGAPQ
jgi:hypothetical protein